MMRIPTMVEERCDATTLSRRSPDGRAAAHLMLRRAFRCARAIQCVDGSIAWSAYANADDHPATPDQLRPYAAALLEAADELERRLR
jgi:hypothetical protein